MYSGKRNCYIFEEISSLLSIKHYTRVCCKPSPNWSKKFLYSFWVTSKWVSLIYLSEPWNLGQYDLTGAARDCTHREWMTWHKERRKGTRSSVRWRCWMRFLHPAVELGLPWDGGEFVDQRVMEEPSQWYLGPREWKQGPSQRYLEPWGWKEGRVWRDPGTRPVPNFFLSTRPVPTRKLKMTGYRVIKFLLERNKTQSWMKNPNDKSNKPWHRKSFFVIFWGKWSRTGAVIFSQCLTPIDLTWLDWQGERECTTAPCVCSQWANWSTDGGALGSSS